jgi:hypothetical protein
LDLGNRGSPSFRYKKKTNRKKNIGRKRKVVKEEAVGKCWRHGCT